MQPNPKTQAPLSAKIGMSIIQSVFFGVGLLAVYAILTLNWYILIAYVVLIVIQAPFNGRNQKYVDLLIRLTQGHLYAHYTRIYE